MATIQGNFSLADVVAAIHCIRAADVSAISSDRENRTEEDDIAKIISSLLTLESHFDDFENLGLIKQLKETLSDLMRSDARSSSSDDNSVGNISIDDNARKFLFDKIRKETFLSIGEEIEVLKCNNEALLRTNHPGLKPNKKKRNDGYFTSINFDDLPDYEPLELTLKTLRGDHCCEKSLRKIFELDADELAEHPQWKELILLLRYSLYNGAEAGRAISLKIHLKLANYLPDYQAIDAVVNLLNYFIDSWIETTPREIDTMPNDESTSSRSHCRHQRNEVQLSDFMQFQLSVFTSVLYTLSERVVLPSMEVEGDRVIASVFLLLSQAALPCSSECVTAVGAKLSKDERIPLLDAVALFTVENGDFLPNVMRRRNPTAVIMHAVHSGLIGVLNYQLEVALGIFERTQIAARDSNENIHDSAMRLSSQKLSLKMVYYGKMLLGLLLPHISNRPLLDYIARQRPPGTPYINNTSTRNLYGDENEVLDASSCLWDGVYVSREDGRFKESWSTEKLQSVGNRAPSLVGSPQLNKLISQLSGAKSLTDLITASTLKSMAGSTKNCPLDRILVQLSKHANHHHGLLADVTIHSQSVEEQSLDLNLDQTCAHTASPTAIRNRVVESHMDLVLQLTEYALRSPIHPHEKSSDSTSFAPIAHTTPHDTVSHAPSNGSYNESILSECSLFCLQGNKNAVDHSYLISFLSHLEASLISASSQTCSTDQSRMSVLKLVISCLSRLSSIMLGCDHCPSKALSAMMSTYSAVLTTMVECSHTFGLDCEGGAEHLRDCVTSIEQAIVALVNVSKGRIGCIGERDRVDGSKEIRTYQLPRSSHLSKTATAPTSSYTSSLLMNPKSSLGAKYDVIRNDDSEGDNSSSCSEMRKTDRSNRPIITSSDYLETDELQHSFIRLCLVILTSHDGKNARNFCGHSNLMDTLAQNGCVDDMVYVITRSLLFSSLVKQIPGVIDSISPEGTSCGNDHERNCSDVTSSLSECAFSVYTFYDLHPLLSALLSDCEGLRDVVLQQLLHPNNLEAIRLILLRTEISPFFAEYSGCGITSDGLISDSSVSSFFSLLTKLAQSGSACSDSVLSLCIHAWVSLKTLFLKIEGLIESEVTSESTGIRCNKKSQGHDDPLIHKDVAAKVLAYASVTGGLDGLHFEATGGLLIDLLYNSLRDDSVCNQARDYILLLNNTACVKSMKVADASADENDEGLDLSTYFFSPTALPVDSSDAPSESDVSISLNAGGLTEPIVQTEDVRREAESGGWDQTTILLAMLQHKISLLSTTTLKSPIALPVSIIPNTEEELQSLILIASTAV